MHGNQLVEEKPSDLKVAGQEARDLAKLHQEQVQEQRKLGHYEK